MSKDEVVALQALADAIDNEHSCHGDNTCDIARAVEEGLYLWAAHLLSGATDCPETDAAASRLNEVMGASEYEQRLEEERRQLLQCPHRFCSSCGFMIWTEEDDVYCDNCGAQQKAVDT